MIDFNIDVGKPTKNEDVELLLQQIDILFDTSPTTVLGDETFGTQYDKYLYNLRLSNDNIRHKVLSDLNSLELFNFIPEVTVHLLQGTERDIILIQIILTREEESYQRIYKIS